MDVRPQETRAGSSRFRWLLVATFLHGLVYLCILPPWMGEDEPWHFENLTHVSNGYWAKSERVYEMEDQREIPLTQIQALRRFEGLDHEQANEVQQEILGSMRTNHFWRRVDWAGRGDRVRNFDEVAWGFSTSQQPPLYYFVTAPIAALTSSLSIEARLFAVRGLSLLLYLATVVLVVRIARQIFGSDGETFSLLAGFLAAWFPMHARMAAVVNNDVLARFLVTLVLYLAVRVTARTASRKHAIALGIACLLAIATKTTAMSALAIAVLGVVLAPREPPVKSRKWLLIPAGLLVCVLAVIFWQSMNNPAVPYSVQELAKRFDYALSGRGFVEVRDSILGSFNWESRPQPGWVRFVFGFGAISALVGAIVAWKRATPGVERRLLLLCALTILVQFSLILLRGVGKGRYLMPAIGAIAVLVVAGLVRVLPERRRELAGVSLVLLWVAYDAMFLWAGLVTNQYLGWGD